MMVGILAGSWNGILVDIWRTRSVPRSGSSCPAPILLVIVQRSWWRVRLLELERYDGLMKTRNAATRVAVGGSGAVWRLQLHRVSHRV
jgi:hypothetical protein